MRWYNKVWNNIKSTVNKKEVVGLNDTDLLKWLGIDSLNGKAIEEVTYFTCLKILSETMGKMPIKLYQDTVDGSVQASTKEVDVYKFIKNRPNPYMTPSTFWSTVEMNRNHYGNAYVYIQREFKRQKFGGTYEVKGLWIMPSENVQVIIDSAGLFGKLNNLYYKYVDSQTGQVYYYKNNEVMHFKTSTTFNGILGLSVRETLQHSVLGSLESQKFMNNLYKNGLTARAALSYTGDLSVGSRKKLQKEYDEFLTGSDNSGKLVPIPLGFQIQPLNIKLTEAQFFELKKYSALQIAGAFGIKPNHINNYEKSSYSNSEMQQLSFLVDTMQFIFKMYEEELDYKSLYNIDNSEDYFYKINYNAILRTDSKSQAEILCKYVNNGVYTPNEARAILDVPRKDGGDVLVMNGNYIPIDMVGEQYKKGGKADE